MPELRRNIKIFPASSSELIAEREKLLSMVSMINKHYPHLQLEIVTWEKDLESGTYGKRMQDAINPLLLSSDIVIFLFYSKTGIFTLEEFELTRQKGKKAFVYFKVGFSPLTEHEMTRYQGVIDIRSAMGKLDTTASYRDFSTNAELENYLWQDLGLYLQNNYPPPHGNVELLQDFNSETVPDILAEWPLPEDIGYPEHPFLGFQRFRYQDARIFFGRNAEIKEILGMLEDLPNKIILLFGQSGAGKSSLLEAGLIPRLEKRGWVIEKRRRDISKGLINDLHEGIKILRDIPGKAKLLLLDQVEEMLTNPNPDIPDEMNSWGSELAKAWREGFGSALLISFRKEYFGEILDLLQKRWDLPCEPIFLHSLTHQGVRDAITGDSDRQSRYDLLIKPTLPALMANDLSPVSEKHNPFEPSYSVPNTAPLLQITLRKMWDLACSERKTSQISFDDKLYRNVQRTNLSDMLQQQLLELEYYFSPDESDPQPSIGRKPLPELHNAIRAGLALDVLRQFVTVELTATSRPLEFLEKEYYPHVPHFRDLITGLKSLFLLTEDSSALTHNILLAHDALAPLVHQRCSTSLLPAQLAWSIVELKRRQKIGIAEIDFSESDVLTVEAGKPYMQCISELMESRLNASKIALEHQRTELRDKTELIFKTLADDALADIAAVEHIRALEKLKAAIAVDAPANIRQSKLEPALLELLFFFSNAGGNATRIIESLQLLLEFPQPEIASQAIHYSLDHQKIEPEQIKELLQMLTTEDVLQELNARYYPEMRPVKGSVFSMGDMKGLMNEQPIHDVVLEDYLIGTNHITFYQFSLFCAATGHSIASCTPAWGKLGTNPAVSNTWYDTILYCNWLSQHLGFSPAYSIDKLHQDPSNDAQYDVFKWLVKPIKGSNGFRLPTEAEWEFAARGGITGTHDPAFMTKYAGSDDLDPVGWFWENSGDEKLNGKWDYARALQNNCHTHPSKTKQANQLGLYDMSGNAWEWCWDWFGEDYYKDSPKKNPFGPDTGSNRIMRGGSWGHNAEDHCRVAYRFSGDPGYRYSGTGFRLARDT